MKFLIKKMYFLQLCRLSADTLTKDMHECIIDDL